MNLPNKLTVVRVILVPFFVFFILSDFIPHHFIIAAALFSIASYTDYLDGNIARKHNLITNFGKFLDPLADKIMVLSALICFTALGLVTPWLVILILFRELAVTSVRLIASGSGKVIAANIWGKAKTVSQIVAILVVLAAAYLGELSALGILPVPEAVLYWCGMFGQFAVAVAAVLAVISGWIYFRENLEFLKDTK